MPGLFQRLSNKNPRIRANRIYRGNGPIRLDEAVRAAAAGAEAADQTLEFQRFLTPAARRATAYAESERFRRGGGARRVRVNLPGRYTLTPSGCAPILLEWLMNFERGERLRQDACPRA